MSTKINDTACPWRSTAASSRPRSCANTPRPTVTAPGSSRVYPGRLFTRNQAITAMALAERLAVGYGDDDPFVIGWRAELGL